MNAFVNKIYRNNTIIYKVILFLITTISIVYLFPKGGQFKYDFNNGQLWKYENLYATFDFAIQKTEEEIKLEKQEIDTSAKMYFLYDTIIVQQVKETFNARINQININDTLTIKSINNFKDIGQKVIQSVYKFGYLEGVSENIISDKDEIIALKKNNEVEDILFKNLYTSKDVLAIINANLGDGTYSYGQKILLDVLAGIITPNVSFDKNFTNKVVENEIENISYTKGKVSKGELIIFKGDIVEGKKLAVLKSLKSESESKVWTDSNYNWIIFGYTILVSLALLMLLLFLHKYRTDIFEDNNKVTFIFFNVFAIIFIQTLVVKYNADYLYVVPLSILPIIIKAFFDARLGLFTHVLTVLLLGYIDSL